MVLKCLLAALSCLAATGVLYAQNLNRPNKTGPMGTQVNTVSGNLFIPRTDLLIHARGIDIDITFYYNSFNYNINKGFGNGWSFSHGISYRLDSTGAAIITWGDGREDAYKPSGSGFTPPSGIFDRFSQYAGNKYFLQTKYGWKYYFDNAAVRRLTRLEDLNGNYLSFTYTDTLLTQITNGAGQSLTLTYTAGNLTSVTDAIESPVRTCRYQYDAAGNLTGFTDPMGNSVKYKYLVNGPLSAMTDKNGNVLDIIYHNSFRISELVTCNNRSSFSYDTTTKATTITDYVPAGTNQVTTYNYERFNDVTWLTRIRGNCCGYNMSFDFDAAGNVIKQTDGNGNIYAYTYDNRGNMLTATDPLNQTSRYTYSADYSRITGFTDPNGNSYTVSYDSRGNAVQQTKPGNVASLAGYAANGDVTSLTDANGTAYNFTYDANGNPVQVTGPLNHSLALAFNARGRLLSITDPRGNAYSAQYDALDRLTGVTDPLSHTLSMSYDANGNIRTTTDQNGHTNSFSYDASDRLVSSTDALGKKATFEFDGMNNVTGFKDKEGNIFRFTYDNRNRISGAVDALGNAYGFNYDANGNLVSETNPDGRTMTYTYDKLDRRTSTSDNIGLLNTVAYDNAGRIISYTNAAGGVVSLQYDSRNRVIRLTDALGNFSDFTYDNNSNLLSVTGKNNQTGHYSYDSRNRIKTYSDNNGNTVKLSYDASGNIVLITDQNNNATLYKYDVLNRLSEMTYPGGKTITYSYDNRGNLLANTLPDGSVISYQYDAVNRPLSRTLPGNNTFTYAYDAKGHLISAANSAGTISITYDALNRPLSETFNGHTTNYSYNIPNRTQTIVYPDGSSVTRSFDIRSRLTGMVRSGAAIATMQYGINGQLLQSTYGNGITNTWQYDFAGRLNTITAGSTVLSLGFSYDAENNVTAITRPQGTEQFSYDPGRRLTGYHNGPVSNNYTYDGVGNRKTADFSGNLTTYSVNNLNQYTTLVNSGGAVSFTYDSNGNLTYDGNFTKTYDAEGRLLSESSASMIISYRYDALGRRIEKTVNGRSYKYYFAGLSAIEQRDGTTDTLLSQTIYSATLAPLMNRSSGRNYYYHLNHLGSVEALTDGSGNVAERYQYDDFGNTGIYDGSGNALSASVTGNRFGYTGQEWDKETGSYLFHFRNYSPVRGSFLQRDPLRYDDGMGAYQYVHNNPGTYNDVLGLRPCPPNDPPPPPKHPYWDFTWASLSNYSNVTSVLSVFEVASTHFNHPGLNFILAPINLVNTVNTANDLYNNYGTNSAGQNVDAGISILSGGLSTGLGTVTVGAFVQGTGSALVTQGATLSGSLSAGATSANGILGALEVGGELTAAGGTVAAAGGLCLFGILNEGWKYGTGGQSLAESAGSDFFDIPLYTSTIENFTSGNLFYDSDYWEQYMYHKKIGNLYEWKEARQRIAERKYTPRPPVPCPPKGPDGGTQNPNPPGTRGGGPTAGTEVISSNDPNEIIGPDGVDAPKWVSIKDPMPYTILFENSKAASAPAKSVRVEYPVDDKQDPNTFSLGSFGFNNLTFTVPPNTPSLYQRLNVIDSLGLYVDVTAGLNVVTGKVFWTFQSIDPVTLLPPADPLKGFLLLQDSASNTSGHGFVNFSIKPKASAATGDTTHAAASIIFDLNEVIPTNFEMNTIDAVAPASTMSPLSTTSNSRTIALSWSSADDVNGSGVKSYTLYAALNGGAYKIIGSGLTRTDTTFTGITGNSYTFFVLATDRAGNTEALRPGAEQTVYINGDTPLPVTWLYFKAVNTGGGNKLSWATATEQNSKEFEIERSVDGKNFSVIGIVTAAGNSTVTTNYNYTDKDAAALNTSLVYYRLKQKDKDGRFVYSAIAVVAMPLTLTGPVVKAYPNPFRQTLNIMIAGIPVVGKDDLVEIYSVDGRLLYQRKVGRRLADDAITLNDLPDLKVGSYVLKTTLNGQLYSFKLLKQ